LRFLNIRFYLVAHPEHIDHVLRGNSRNYVKAGINYTVLKKLFGEGLITSAGSHWREQRRLLQPAVQPHSVGGLGSLITDTTLEMLRRWRNRANPDQAFDLLPELTWLTLKILGLAFFRSDISDHAASISKAWKAANEYFGQFNVNHFLPFVPTTRCIRSGAAVRELRRIASELVSQHAPSNTGSGDLLSTLMREREAKPTAVSLRQITDNVVTFILTGYETVATALAWVWYLLGRHPEVEARLRAEVAEVLGGRTPTINDLPALRLCRMVIEESMRLYPPAWFMSRSPLEDDRIGGYRIPKGSLLIVSPYVTHRHPDFWPKPEHFDPYRFSPARSEGRPRFAYFPFGGGPRSCVGASFALTEMQLILATVSQHYSLTLATNHRVEEQALVTLRPRSGLKVTVHAI
jgi:cytochrome P450